MAKSFKQGDRVEWNSQRLEGRRHGGAQDHRGDRGRRAQGEGLEDEPQYLVKSEASGGTAVHKPEALRRRSG